MSPEKTVHIVDDDPIVSAFLVDLVEDAGYRSTSHGSGLEFLESCTADAEGCVLLDMQMPGLSGIEVQRELARRCPGLSVILITGHGEVAAAVQAIQAGAVDFVRKPFTAQRVLDAIERAIGAPDLASRAEGR